MAAISTTKFTERLTRRLKKAGLNRWVAQSSGDAWGKYLLFATGGACVGGLGWTQAEAEQRVGELITEHLVDNGEIEVE